jgi:transposase
MSPFCVLCFCFPLLSFSASTCFFFLPTVPVGIEATGSMLWFLNLMDELGIECRVGHPATIRAAEPRKQKHDRRDAELILKLLVEKPFPAIWLPSKELLDLRALLLHRHQWVRYPMVHRLERVGFKSIQANRLLALAFSRQFANCSLAVSGRAECLLRRGGRRTSQLGGTAEQDSRSLAELQDGFPGVIIYRYEAQPSLCLALSHSNDTTRQVDVLPAQAANQMLSANIAL